MSDIVLDASALLALLKDEPGSAEVAASLATARICGYRGTPYIYRGHELGWTAARTRSSSRPARCARALDHGHPEAGAALRQPFGIGAIVVVAEEHALAAVSPLRHMRDPAAATLANRAMPKAPITREKLSIMYGPRIYEAVDMQIGLRRTA
jgi:hypothetical protein